MSKCKKTKSATALRPRRFNKERILYPIVATVLLTFAAIDVMSRASWTPLEIGYLLAFLMLDVAMAIRPIAGGTAMMVLSIVGTLIAEPMSPNPLVTAMAALTILGYHTPKRGFILGCVEIFGSIANVLLNYPVNFDIYGAINMCALVAMFYFTGYALHWKDQAAKAALLQAQLNHLQHTMNVATSIHDTTSNNLSTIMQVAQVHLLDKTGADTNDWILVNTAANNALYGVHRVITMLDDSGNNIESTQHQSFMEQLESRVESEEATLHSSGFIGATTITGIGDVHEQQRREIILNVLSEIYCNIARHGIATFPYTVSIVINNDITIQARNTCRPTNRSFSIPHGKGLALHAKQIRQLGGTLDSSRNGNHWNITIRIPLQQSSAMAEGK
ncbi:hypothetical protein [Bifidobacterium tissieri]|uniref:Histidine kinase n=1 Tax=Bifidobacterium tissieri TaxID=1630162 RepID=A0A5M9ZXZ2_9BIFI|nr:hypothetical protein [Bifidobacterium tissieri]KAA8831535.1 hypothetical protein EMO89_02050 [Bifidobacterium tissieri]KAA8832501.1 hypothetical protein EM849_04780 [Bifidobacterium tissieri]